MPPRTRKRKPAPEASLTRERIAEAALAQISARGREALSMRNLAAELGYEAMSLYHHVDGIDGVLDAVVDRLLGSLPVDARASDPRKALETFAKSYLALAESHPNAFPLIATRLFRTERSVETAGHAVTLLRELGLAPRAALRQARILGAYLNGAGLALAAWKVSAQESAHPAKGNRELAPLSANINAVSVRADLDAGLAGILDAI